MLIGFSMARLHSVARGPREELSDGGHGSEPTVAIAFHSLAVKARVVTNYERESCTAKKRYRFLYRASGIETTPKVTSMIRF